jgi:hypothetical protein
MPLESLNGAAEPGRDLLAPVAQSRSRGWLKTCLGHLDCLRKYTFRAILMGWLCPTIMTMLTPVFE